jgi:hypothetical protein
MGGGSGANDSGWQDSADYTDSGLNPSTQYCYQVSARDKSANQNETAVSSNECATTQAGCSATDVHVEALACGTARGSQGKKYGQVTVTIHDDCGNPVVGADVTGTFTGDYNEQLTETTNGSGVAVITTTTQIKKPSYQFCVDGMVASLPYDSNDNVVDCCNN